MDSQAAVLQLSHLANQLIGQGAEDQAEYIYRAILDLDPGQFDIRHSLGVLEYRQGRFAEALADLGAALGLRPDDGVALSNLGLVQALSGDLQAALLNYDRALALQPAFAEAHLGRGDVLMRLGRPQLALASYDAALALRSDLAEAHNNRGAALMAVKRPVEALDSYDAALIHRPDFPEALNGRGAALSQLKHPQGALEAYDRALGLRPDFAEALNNRGAALRDLGRPAEALDAYDRAIVLNPHYAEAFNNRGAALADLRRPQEALTSYEQAIALEPGNAEAYDNMALMLAEIGRFEAAWAALETAIGLAPDRPRFYYNLTATKRIARDDPHLTAMQALARDMDSLAVDDQIDLNFALAKALADIGDRDASFRRLIAGAALKRIQIPYDEAAVLAGFERTRAVFAPALMQGGKGVGDPSAVPVFIVGMPRSGTSLVEQILASHPQVFGAGETDAFARALADFGEDAARALQSPDAAAALSAEQLSRLGARYAERIGREAPDALRIVDKTMENFRYLGLIRLALPQARIIHVRRDPLDTCLSCFSKLFTGYLPYTYDLAELGRYYRGYEGLMAHWRGVIPPEALLEVRYEQVVVDLERQARAIVAHCGLDWDPLCLDFHLTDRPVRTASATQVRQPIYNSSVGRWRDYEPYLAPLRAALQLPTEAAA